MTRRPALVVVDGARALLDHAPAAEWLRSHLDALAPVVIATMTVAGPTTADDVPWYAITAEGRASLALSAEGSAR